MQPLKLVLPVACGIALAAFFITLGPSTSQVQARDLAAAPAAANWVTNGNSVGNKDFIGTTNNKSLVFKTNNTERMRIDTSGKVGIGTKAPSEQLTVQTATANYGFVHTDGTITVGSWIGTGGGAPAGGWYGTKSNHPLHLFTNNGSASLTVRTNGNIGIGTTTPSSKLEIAAQDGLAITGYQPFLTLRDTNSGNAKSVIQSASGEMLFYPQSFIGGNPAVVIKNSTGNVGIGTSAPSAQLSIVKSGAPQPDVQGVLTGLKVGTPAGSIPFAVKQNTAESTIPTLAYFETSNGNLGYLGANTGTFVLGSAANKWLGLNVNGSTRAMTIYANGQIGIGTVSIGAKLHIHGDAGSDVLRAESSSGIVGLRVTPSGYVQVRLLDQNFSHVCHSSGTLSVCGSAAEYVPSIDGGKGFPETADLVSIAPNAKNPYGDEHGPFVVQKSATACDPNLLGFITTPEKGADGVKLNEHYLPLAIYGYFPAKVTTANGIIKRGDALTSSSKPGYAMKATSACKIIGYALQDATGDGEIQVFANHGENSAPEIAALKQENQALKEMLAEMDARLKALENVSPVSYKTTR